MVGRETLRKSAYLGSVDLRHLRFLCGESKICGIGFVVASLRQQVEVAGLHSAAIPRGLLLHHFYLPVDNLAGEPVDGHMNPVVLFAFDNEIVLQAVSTWLEVAGLGYYVDQ